MDLIELDRTLERDYKIKKKDGIYISPWSSTTNGISALTNINLAELIFYAGYKKEAEEIATQLWKLSDAPKGYPLTEKTTRGILAFMYEESTYKINGTTHARHAIKFGNLLKLLEKSEKAEELKENLKNSMYSFDIFYRPPHYEDIFLEKPGKLEQLIRHTIVCQTKIFKDNFERNEYEIDFDVNVQWGLFMHSLGHTEKSKKIAEGIKSVIDINKYGLSYNLLNGGINLDGNNCGLATHWNRDYSPHLNLEWANLLNITGQQTKSEEVIKELVQRKTINKENMGDIQKPEQHNPSQLIRQFEQQKMKKYIRESELEKEILKNAEWMSWDFIYINNLYQKLKGIKAQSPPPITL